MEQQQPQPEVETTAEQIVVEENVEDVADAEGVGVAEGAITGAEIELSVFVDDDAAQKAANLLRQSVLAAIFPERRGDGDSIRFDPEAAQYIIVASSDAQEATAAAAMSAPTIVDGTLEPSSMQVSKEGEADSPKSSTNDKDPQSVLATTESSSSASTSTLEAPVKIQDEDVDKEDASLASGPFDDAEDEEHPPGTIVCSICLDPILATDSKFYSAQCPHTFHCDCLLEWVQHQPRNSSSRRRRNQQPRHNDNCPTCRTPLWDPDVYKRLEEEEAERLGIDTLLLATPTASDWVDIPEPSRAMRYIQYAMSMVCCLTFVVYVILSTLVPSFSVGGARWS